MNHINPIIMIPHSILHYKNFLHVINHQKYYTIFKYKHKSGTPINVKVEKTKQIQLLEACNPKEGILTMLYKRIKITIYLNIPSIIDIKLITINLLNIKYKDSNPYLISLNLTSS